VPVRSILGGGRKEKVDILLQNLGVCSLRECEISRQWVLMGQPRSCLRIRQ
jgi:hypothetical protein